MGAEVVGEVVVLLQATRTTNTKAKTPVSHTFFILTPNNKHGQWVPARNFLSLPAYHRLCLIVIKYGGFLFHFRYGKEHKWLLITPVPDL